MMIDKGRAWLYGLAIGAALMYIFDPARGRRRRALVRDQVVHIWHKSGDLLDKKTRDLQNRVTGMVAETRSKVKGETDNLKRVKNEQQETPA
jgi:hypothetical protein